MALILVLYYSKVKKKNRENSISTFQILTKQNFIQIARAFRQSVASTNASKSAPFLTQLNKQATLHPSSSLSSHSRLFASICRQLAEPPLAFSQPTPIKYHKRLISLFPFPLLLLVHTKKNAKQPTLCLFASPFCTAENP